MEDAIIHAAGRGSLDLVETLVEQNDGLVHLKGPGGWTALMVAALRGHARVSRKVALCLCIVLGSVGEASSRPRECRGI
jgi:ankyrin repeat protein